MIITEEALIKISAIGILLGVAALYFISGTLKPETAKVSEINQSFVGRYVNVTGTVSEVKKSESGLAIILGENSTKIKAVFWNSLLDGLKLKGFNFSKIRDGSKLNFVGIVQSYKGSIEVIATKTEINILPQIQ